MKKKFKVFARITTDAFIIIEADSADEAIEIAEHTDGGDFFTDDSGMFEVLKDYTEEV